MSKLKRLEMVLKRAKEHRPFVSIDMSWEVLLTVIASLKLAIDHPHYPRASKERMQAFVDAVITATNEEEPELAEMMQTGGGLFDAR